ncbi:MULTISPECIES: PadR family transcriptional regulator [unclassified Natrinema]|uniref:PadR family transcriptional regulator n=1 Tax=unclassified Natrinema TaxID=2622230 RepID=UPI0018C90025|nr:MULTISPECIES: PadR family transcriptional regulator [unclassified Natrinema]
MTKFQTRILEILAEDSRYGLAIKSELEDYYGVDVNHGRLYPNLDELCDLELVEKSKLDKRTNNYAITETARAFLEDDLGWQDERVNGGDSR